MNDNTKTGLSGAALLIKALKEAGVKYMFGYTGGAIMPVFDEMEKDGTLKYIMARHEQGAAFMAQGVSRASISTDHKQVGVCLSTSGPGAMNLVTGVADAIMDSTPIIAITGQVATGVIGTDAFQETDVVGVMMPITKQTYMPTKAEEIEETLHEAMYVATTGRPGPINIDIPKDAQVSKVGDQYNFELSKYKPNIPGYEYDHHPDPEQSRIDAAVELINKSKRPIIFCGRGVVLSNAGEEITKFAKKVHAPITCTIHGISAFPVNDPSYIGWMGMHGDVAANRAIQNSDLIIAFGMRFDDRVTGKLDEYAKDADVIHVEIDPSEIDKNVKTTVAINADCKKALMAFNKNDKLQNTDRSEWFAQIEEFRKEMGAWHDAELKSGIGGNGKLLMKSIITKLSDLTEGNDIVVPDVGQHQMITLKYYKFNRINTAFTSGGAGTMGCSLPMALGVKLVRPDERVWSISGDGGFQMNIQELGVIMEHKIDVKIIILNNHFLGMVRQWQTLFFEERYAGTPIVNPQYEFIAKGYGIPYRQVNKIDEVEESLIWARDHEGACILEFMCDKSEIVLPMIPSGRPFNEMIVNRPDAKN